MTRETIERLAGVAMTRIAPPEYGPYRMTIPVRELLLSLGNELIEPLAPGDTYRMTEVSLCGTLPAYGTILLVLIGRGADQHRGLRLREEAAYPGEWPREQGIAWHERGDWVPCPTCGHALVWYEAGYVPGYRICTRGHHAQLASDGRSAKKKKVRTE